MCCCCGSRWTVIYAGIYTLLQSLTWAVLAVLGISLYNCGFEIEPDEKNPALYIMYFMYFFNTECANVPDILNITHIFCDYIEDKYQNIGINCSLLTDSGTTLPPEVTLPPEWGSTLPSLPSWPDKFELSETTATYMTVYVVLSLVWTASSICLILLGLFKVRNCFAYMPWIIATAAISIFDVVAVVTYGQQISESETVEGLLRLLGLQNIPTIQGYNVTDFLKDADGYSMIPALIMTLIVSRGIVFWIKNLVMLVVVIFASRSLHKSKYPELPRYPHSRINLSKLGQNNSGFMGNNSERTDHNANSTGTEYDNEGYLKSNNSVEHSYEPVLYNLPIPHANIATAPPHYNNMPGVQPTAPPLYKNEIVDHNNISTFRNNTPVSYTNAYSQEPEYDEYGYIKSNRPFSYTPGNPQLPSLTPRPKPPPETYRDSPSIPWFQNIPPAKEVRKRKDTPMGSEEPWNRRSVQRADSEKPLVKPKPINRQYSFQIQDRPQENQRNLGSQLPPDELRSQLPWSYFGPRDAPMKPKLRHTSQSVQEEDEDMEMPPVPVPDYTLHFGKNPRPSTSTSSWSDPERASRTSTASSGDVLNH